jgi:hypothetical protein
MAENLEAWIEPFSTSSRRQRGQGRKISHLVSRSTEKDWLATTLPETLAQFRERDRAIEAVGRLALIPRVEFGIIRIGTKHGDRTAYGLTRKISNIEIWPPGQNQSIRGPYIDYWTVSGLQPEQHEDIFRRLIADCQGKTVVALLARGQEERAQAITGHFCVAGQRGPVTVLGEDPLGLDKVQSIQAYSAII